MKIDSPDNKRFKHLLKLKQDSKYRAQEGKLLLEGKNLIRDLQGKATGTLFTVYPETLEGFETVLISPSLAKKLSDTQHPELYFAETKTPKESNTLPFPLVAFDAVSDPGNLGTLLRTALALGWGGALFLPGCCDPFNPKVIRASKGALFTLPYRTLSFEELDKLKADQPCEILAADIRGKLPKQSHGNRIVLILGNEGKGLSEESRQRGTLVAIPMSNQVESLNVSIAGGILMYLLKEGT